MEAVIRDFKALRYEERNGVAWITLNRPEVLNAFDTAMMHELHECWRGLRDNDEVNAIVLTRAQDQAFCTGVDRAAADVGEPDRATDLGGQRGGTPLHFNDPGDFLPPKTAGDLWKPVIAAVNGMACGGAFYLLGEADIIIAADHATFFDTHTTYGMAAVFEPMMMLQRMPIGEVLRVSLMGAYERMSARRAHEIGLVQEVVPGAALRWPRPRATWRRPSPLSRHWRSRQRSARSGMPSSLATGSQHIADTDTAATVLLQAIARAGSLDPTAINNQIAKTNGMFVAGKVQFNAQHTSTLPMVEEQWQNGKNVIIAPLNRSTAKVLFPLPTG